MPEKSKRPSNGSLSRLLEFQRALASFSKVASTAMEPSRFLQHACGQISRVTHIKHTKVLQYRRDQGDLLLVAGVGWKPGVVGTATLSTDSATPAGRSIQTAAPVEVRDLPNDQEFRSSKLLVEHGIVSLLNVPVMIDGNNWGLLEVDAEEPRAFDEADVTFMTTFANMIGAALARYESEQRLVILSQERSKERELSKTLVTELQHRTKNNLQTIIAFLSLLRRNADSQKSRDDFSSVMHRVHAIAIAHDQLSFGKEMSHVDFGSYLRSLCANIDPRLDNVVLEVSADPAPMPLDKAVPAGLIVNELVTNAFKYAFDEGEAGVIRVSFLLDQRTGDAVVTVEDNGKGMKDPREGGLGLTLIEAFARQLSGVVERLDLSKGTGCKVSFPVAL
ncbi:two-component sensor histidine kinase [Rhodoligotrophos appendicifer]|uniref:histidine kinase dimerization/phosphoacceptor domain -containing protein n=1 Tax=Rhodoligotrophos appendicifer TaxID=987056 RepID=UPI001184D107|nr:histidine kinase dimerization/phosphoacceptor domain -containing protein [Rhodoligotrophos appendicifer]